MLSADATREQAANVCFGWKADIPIGTVRAVKSALWIQTARNLVGRKLDFLSEPPCHDRLGAWIHDTAPKRRNERHQQRSGIS